MKQLSLLQQQNANRRSNSFNRSTAALDSGSDGGIKSPAALFWLILHGLCCLVSLVLGFRFSRLVFFLLFSPASTTTNSPSIKAPFLRSSVAGTLTPVVLEPPHPNRTGNGSPGSRVVVGRHGILIRPWPHPNAEEVMRAHRILERVQKEQRLQYGVKDPRGA